MFDLTLSTSLTSPFATAVPGLAPAAGDFALALADLVPPGAEQAVASPGLPIGRQPVAETGNALPVGKVVALMPDGPAADRPIIAPSRDARVSSPDSPPTRTIDDDVKAGDAAAPDTALIALLEASGDTSMQAAAPDRPAGPHHGRRKKPDTAAMPTLPTAIAMPIAPVAADAIPLAAGKDGTALAITTSPPTIAPDAMAAGSGEGDRAIPAPRREATARTVATPTVANDGARAAGINAPGANTGPTIDPPALQAGPRPSALPSTAPSTEMARPQPAIDSGVTADSIAKTGSDRGAAEIVPASPPAGARTEPLARPLPARLTAVPLSRPAIDAHDDVGSIAKVRIGDGAVTPAASPAHAPAGPARPQSAMPVAPTIAADMPSVIAPIDTTTTVHEAPAAPVPGNAPARPPLVRVQVTVPAPPTTIATPPTPQRLPFTIPPPTQPPIDGAAVAIVGRPAPIDTFASARRAAPSAVPDRMEPGAAPAIDSPARVGPSSQRAIAPASGAAPRAAAVPAPSAGVVFGFALSTGPLPGRRVDATEPSPREIALQALSAASGSAQVAGTVLATGDAQQATLDMHRDDWPQAMIDHIEALHDAADAISTRITLIPNALGKVDVSIKHDGDTVNVHFAADVPQTRTLLADAQPRLAEAALVRGIKLGQATVDPGGGEAGRQQPQQQQNTSNTPLPPRPASVLTKDDAAAPDSTRLA